MTVLNERNMQAPCFLPTVLMKAIQRVSFTAVPRMIRNIQGAQITILLFCMHFTQAAFLINRCCEINVFVNKLKLIISNLWIITQKTAS